jgi:PLP dependent protein
MTDIESNLAEVRDRIAEAAQRANRNPDGITLVAVSKTFPVDAIMTAYEHGVRHFGENRAREGISKITAIRPYIPGPQPTWHMVGHIQSRKAKLVVENYDYVHSVDRLKIARRLSRYAEEAEQTLPILLECNVSGEEAKYGFDLADWEHEKAKLEGFLNAVEEVLTKRGLSVQGLMTMPPFTEEAEAARPFFASLRGLLDVLRERFPNTDWHHLSMGMTNDFEVAVEEGATMVRVGRAIFGPRK